MVEKYAGNSLHRPSRISLPKRKNIAAKGIEAAKDILMSPQPGRRKRVSAWIEKTLANDYSRDTKKAEYMLRALATAKGQIMHEKREHKGSAISD